MENKQYILILIALLVLGGLGFYFVSSNSETESLDSESVRSPSQSDTAMMDDSKESDSKMMSDDLKMMMDEAPEGALVYEFNEGSASYVAQKRFLQKEDAVVEGRTEDVSGAGWINPETGALYVSADVDLVSLASDSSDRDADVLNMLEATTANLVLELDTSNIALGEEFSLEAPATVTVNGVENTYTVAIEGVVTEDSFNATGTMSALISDFGLEVPSLANIYTVDDEIELSFTVEGSVVENTAMMEEDTSDSDSMMEEDTTEEDSMMEEGN